MRKIFIEGGGHVVSEFLLTGVLDRLQLAVAPVLVGEGRRGIRVTPQARLRDALRPSHRLYQMGEDLLFDYDLRAAVPAATAASAEFKRLR
jgi:diaminohydroxyphosphoribosylaminopyrimidine deaminase/5-amino-6-(5-phosphoribosylamino)uracil reductase